jgi:hypothetical protein
MNTSPATAETPLVRYASLLVREAGLVKREAYFAPDSDVSRFTNDASRDTQFRYEPSAVQKRCQEPFSTIFGRPRGRRVPSRFSRFAVRRTQSSEPNGCPRRTDRRSASHAACSIRLRLIHPLHPAARLTGSVMVNGNAEVLGGFSR